jgi:hypothetical protein
MVCLRSQEAANDILVGDRRPATVDTGHMHEKAAKPDTLAIVECAGTWDSTAAGPCSTKQRPLIQHGGRDNLELRRP